MPSWNNSGSYTPNISGKQFRILMESYLKIKKDWNFKTCFCAKDDGIWFNLGGSQVPLWRVTKANYLLHIFHKRTHKDILYPREGKAILLLTIGFAKKAGRIFLKKQNCRSEISTFEGVLIFLSASKWAFPKRQSSVQEKSWDWDWLLFPRNHTSRRRSTKWWHRWEELLFPKLLSHPQIQTPWWCLKKPLKTWLFPQRLV